MAETAEKKLKTEEETETKAEGLTRVVLVTGANKGIGEGIVRALLAQGHTVIATARDPTLGARAMEGWKGSKGTVKFFKCDISNKSDVENLRAFVECDVGRLDSLINNAGIAFKGDIFGADECEQTIAVNYTGTKYMCDAFLPLLEKSALGGRCVNICSTAGNLANFSKKVQGLFSDPELTLPALDALMRQFPEDIRRGDYKEKGWPQSMYSTSKLGEIALTKILAKKVPKVQITACCPGFVNTDMSSGRGRLTVEQGADTPVFLATDRGLTAECSGLFFQKRTPIAW